MIWNFHPKIIIRCLKGFYFSYITAIPTDYIVIYLKNDILFDLFIVTCIVVEHPQNKLVPVIMYTTFLFYINSESVILRLQFVHNEMLWSVFLTTDINLLKSVARINEI